MITAIIGLPGAGKTLFSVYLAQKYLKEGCAVASNFRIQGAMYSYNVLDLIMWVASGHPKDPNYKPRIAIVDELNNLFNSRDWNKLDPRIRLALSQHRKAGEGNNLIYTTQSFGFADLYFRSLTSKIYVMRRFIFGRFLAKAYYPGEMSQGNEFIPKEKAKTHKAIIFNPKPLYPLFDTYERIVSGTGAVKEGEEWLTPSASQFELVPRIIKHSTNIKTQFRKFQTMAKSFGNIVKAKLKSKVILGRWYISLKSQN